MKNSQKSDDQGDQEENTIRSNLTNIMNEGLNDEKLREKFSSGETTLRSKDSGSKFFNLNRYRRGLETCPQAKTSKSGHTIFFSFFSDASERRV